MSPTICSKANGLCHHHAAQAQHLLLLHPTSPALERGTEAAEQCQRTSTPLHGSTWGQTLPASTAAIQL